MRVFVETSAFFGAALSLAAYGTGTIINKKCGLELANPLLISIIIVITFLHFTGTDYIVYNDTAKYISYLLTPATVSLAVPLYERLSLLKKNWKAIIIGISSGVLTSLCCIFVMSAVFNLNHKEYVTLLPKSITTAIGIGVSEELGGYVTLTVAVIIITGILGNIFAESACKLFGITEPAAKGTAIGSASHAIGTSKAIEMGETEGAISGLSIAVSGLLTVIGAPVFARFL